MNLCTITLSVTTTDSIWLVLAQLAADLVALDRDVLDVVVLDLVHEPGIIVDRGLRLRHEVPEDRAESADQDQPEPGGCW